tara:strand:+ start:437 stop:670 length:234 start_codon:yes stop_codon:yes gene_type:complete
MISSIAANTMVEYATPEHFKAWREEAKSMTNSSLIWAIKDCRNAEQAMRGWNPIKEGFYSDQACTFSDELNKRRLAK